MRRTCVVVPLIAACGPDTPERAATDPRALHPLSLSEDLRIVDDTDSEVLLRGVNLTSLGDYFQGSPENPATMPTTDADWRAMAARGLSVVRLVVHWSRIEPVRGQVDQTYLDEVEAYVDAAADHGLYTVIDMHQDAYSAHIWTDPSETCPAGTGPARGWDGAPAWATRTDGLSTCITADRNSAPAVVAAWNHFYRNTDGIRDRYVATWRAVAERFAGRPEVAGYDLINEPETSMPADELRPLYDALLSESIRAIRDAEADARFDHLIFLEPTIPAGDPSKGLVFADPARLDAPTHHLVGAMHNYAESIQATGLTIEQTNDLIWGMAAAQGTGVWIGEYGFWDTSEITLDKVRRYALDEDASVQGGAWWQWRQPCGDPHSLEWDGQTWVPSPTIVHLNQLGCPGDEDLGPTTPFLDVLGRGFPRVSPGRIDRLESDPATGDLALAGRRTGADGRLVLWTPTDGRSHVVVVEGLGEVREQPVEGGRLVTAVPTADTWSVEVRPR